MFAVTVALLLFIVTSAEAVNKNCSVESSCTCDLKSAGLLNLAGSGGALDYVEVEVGVYTYRYYPCGMREDWGGDCRIANSPAVCQLGPDNENFVLGTSKSYVLTRAVAKGDSTYFDFLFQDGTSDFIYGKRSAVVKVSCERTGPSQLQFISEAPKVKYNFIFKTDKACFNPAEDSTTNVIFIALIVILPIAALGYFAVGVGVMAYRGQRKWRLIPNLDFWRDAPVLFLDGFLFTFSCLPFVRKYLSKQTSKQDYDEVPS